MGGNRNTGMRAVLFAVFVKDPFGLDVVRVDEGVRNLVHMGFGFDFGVFAISAFENDFVARGTRLGAHMRLIVQHAIMNFHALEHSLFYILFPIF